MAVAMWNWWVVGQCQWYSEREVTWGLAGRKERELHSLPGVP
jgi:hypothetical protein